MRAPSLPAAVALLSAPGALLFAPGVLRVEGPTFPLVEARAQEVPPPPRSPGEFRLPPSRERRLANGMRLLVVPRGEMPFVTATLVLPGGRTADPAGRVGLADMTARLLMRGTSARTARELQDTLDFLGARLEASAGSDWTTVSAETTTPHLPSVLDLMADAVLHPAFPAEEVEALRLRKREALETEMASPAGLADRAFLRAVYGGHAYGRLETAETLRAVDRTSVVDFHRTWHRPGQALLVLAGDVEADRAAALAEGAFGAWEPNAVPAVDRGLPPLRHAPRVVLVHQPTTDRAVLRLGHTMVRGAHPDWTALSVLSEVLGGGASGPFGRLSGALREARLDASVGVRLQRRLDYGLLAVLAESRMEEAARVVEVLYAELLRLRREPVSLAELRDARGFLAGAWPLRFETPGQLADRLTTARLLGVPDSALAAGPERIAAMGAEDLREVAAARIQPGELVFVVVGDAARLQGELAGLGEVSVVDARGDPVTLAALVPGGRSETLDASGLRPGSAEYRVTFDGRPLGRAVRTLEAGGSPGTMVYRGRADMGSESVSQSVTFTVPGFELVAADARTESGGDTVSLEFRVRDGRLVGSVRAPGGTGERIDHALPRGAVVGDMVELVPRVAELREGRELVVPVVDLGSGAVQNVRYRVAGVEEVSVPAGTFEAYRVEIEGTEPRTMWIRRTPPHVPLRILPGRREVVLELVSGGVPDPGL